MPIDYSKWKDIEVSDDEDDTHPNIDTPSLFRWRHRARLERMAEMEKEKNEINTHVSSSRQKKDEIKSKLEAASEEEKSKLEDELKSLDDQIAEWRAKEAELEKKEQLAPWNVDTICNEGFSTSRINVPKPKEDEPVLTEEEREQKMRDFLKQNKSLMKKFSMMSKFDDSKAFLLDQPHLCCDDTANYLVIECLNHEMEDKHSLMEHVAHQSVVMQYLLELAKQLDVSAQSPQLISSFFTKIKLADKTYMDAFEDELKAFKGRIEKRAQEKIAEAVEEYDKEEKEKRAGPGGLDPADVFESLPRELQICFESRDISKLQTVLGALDEKDARYHMKRCIDSGLWVADKSTLEEDDEDFDEPTEATGADKEQVDVNEENITQKTPSSDDHSAESKKSAEIRQRKAPNDD